MGQYNLLHLCTRDRAELGSRLAAALGLQSWWNKVHYSGTTAISTTDLKDRMLSLFSSIHPSSRGAGALASMGMFRDCDLYTYLYSSVTDFAFDASILYWHIATDVYLSESKVEHDEKQVAAVQVLSNYMMFLMIAMLTGPIQQGQYVDTCSALERLWNRHCSGSGKQNEGNPVTAARGPPQNHKWSMLKKLFQRDEPNASRMRQRKELANKFLSASFLDELVRA